jgi:hypothetical protein
MTMNRTRTSIAALLVLLLAAPAALAQAPGAGAVPRHEELRYEWHLGRLVGRLAGIFLPSQGQGVLTSKRDNGRITSELLITSEQSRDGEYWRYGSRIDADSGHAREAWSSYLWRGEKKSRREEIAKDGVMDVVAGIYAIRKDMPATSRQMEIWSDGKLYPVLVIPRGQETRTVAGKQVATRHYSIRGYDAPGARRWKGSLELWFATDAAATPVEIHIERNLANLQLRLQELP